MRAVVIDGRGAFRLERRADPVPGPGQVVVRPAGPGKFGEVILVP
ncbi:hypothetical protein [Streptomyces sp. x-19]